MPRGRPNAEVHDLLDMEVIKPSNSPYNSPPVMIKKKGGNYHCCLDFSNITNVTLFDVEPMPQPEDIFAKMSKDTYFSKLDFYTRTNTLNLMRCSIGSQCRSLSIGVILEYLVAPVRILAAVFWTDCCFLQLSRWNTAKKCVTVV